MKHDYYYHRWNLFWFLVCYKLHKFTLLYNETSNRLFYMAYRYNSICITINIFINFYNVFIDFTAIALSSHHCQKLQKRDNFLTPPPLCTIKQWALLGQIQFFVRLKWKKYFATYIVHSQITIIQMSLNSSVCTRV